MEKICLHNLAEAPRAGGWVTMTRPRKRFDEDLSKPPGLRGRLMVAGGPAEVVAGAMLSSALQLIHVWAPELGPWTMVEGPVVWNEPHTILLPEAERQEVHSNEPPVIPPPEAERQEAHFEAHSETQFKPSRWADRARALDMVLQVHDPDGYTDLDIGQAFRDGGGGVLETGPARIVLYLRSRIGTTPLVADIFVYLYSRQPWAEVEIQIVNSSPEEASYNFWVQRIELLSELSPRFWTGRRRGAGDPEAADSKVGGWAVQLCGETNFGDAQGLAWWGSLLGAPPEIPIVREITVVGGSRETVPLPPDPDDEVRPPLPPCVPELLYRAPPPIQEPKLSWPECLGESAAIWRLLGAQYLRPVVGFDSLWTTAGTWGPFGVAPGLESFPRSQAEASLGRIMTSCIGDLEAAGGPWDSVPYTLSPFPGQTGDQYGFGVTKGVFVLAPGRPAWLFVGLYSALHGLACRPIHHRDTGGLPIQASNYHDPKGRPRWVTWDEDTHYDASVSPERLGKGGHRWTRPWGPHAPPDRHGWKGHDNQHMSPLQELATYALTGSWLLRLDLLEIREKFLAGQTLEDTLGQGHPTTGLEADRAVGRTLLTGSWLAWALGDVEIAKRCDDRVLQAVARHWVGAGVKGPVRPISICAPDGRGPGTYPYWRPPFLALGAVGLYSVWRTSDLPKARELALEAVRTLAHYGTVLREGHYKVLWGVRWLPDGTPLPPEAYEDPSQVQRGKSSWALWSAAAFRIGALLARMVKDEGDLARLCSTIWRDIEAIHGQDFRGLAPWRFSEWIAVD